jgi:hypothetical protein
MGFIKRLLGIGVTGRRERSAAVKVAEQYKENNPNRRAGRLWRRKVDVRDVASEVVKRRNGSVSRRGSGHPPESARRERKVEGRTSTAPPKPSKIAVHDSTNP